MTLADRIGMVPWVLGGRGAGARGEQVVEFAAHRLAAASGVSFEIALADGRVIAAGPDTPAFRIEVRDPRGLFALGSLDELRICEAYMDGALDIEGDMRAAASLHYAIDTKRLWITAWRRLQPMLSPRAEVNARWVQNHYDRDNIQLHFLDRDYNTYTPGVFERDDETLEQASERKHRLAFEGLGLKAGDRILDVGFGWGSFLRYAARRGVHVTGVTLSRHQLAYVKERLVEPEGLPADLVYSDFFEWGARAGERFDGISMLGVIEELADYPAVLAHAARLLKPGKKVYLDFMAATEDFTFPAFVTRYIYQGITSRVYMPKFVDAATRSPFEMTAVFNDRDNYARTLAAWFDRLEDSRDAVRREFGERMYRMFRMYLAGAANMLVHRSHLTTAYRVFLELPTDAAVTGASPAGAGASAKPGVGPRVRELAARVRAAIG